MGTRIIILAVAVLMMAFLASGLRSEPEGHVSQANFVRGDFNLDGQVCMGDPIGLLQVFWGRDCYALCEDSADSNDDGRLDLSDVIDMLGIIFFDGDRYLTLTCGPDTTQDNLGCEYEPAVCEDSGPDTILQTDSGQQYYPE